MSYSLRALLNLVNTNTLTEAMGLANRRPGEEFINPAGDIIVFQDVVFYPEGGGQYETQAELLDAIRQVEIENKNVKIEWTNTPTRGTLGFGVATFTDKNEKNLRLVGRYFGKINHIFQANNFPNKVPGDYSLNRATSIKTRAGLMPQDVLTDFIGLTPDEIVNQVVDKFGPDHPLTSVTYAVANGQSFPIYIDKGDLEFTAFRDYFCEILQPLILVSGNQSNYSGNAKEAEKLFFRDNGFTTCKITFNTGKNTGLYDSILTNTDGKEIRLSTKNIVGSAAASAKNLLEAINELKKSNPTLIKKYSDTVEICETISNFGQHGAPVELAKKFGIITSAEGDAIYNFRASGDIGELNQKLRKILDAKTARTKTESRVVEYYALLSEIAVEVEQYVNANTNFSQEAADILNNSAIIQMYSNVEENAGRFILYPFKTVYPSNIVSRVMFSSNKSYFATGIKGNFTFILKTQTGANISDQIRSAAGIDVGTVAPTQTKERPVDRVNITPASYKGLRSRRTDFDGTNTEPRQKR